MGASVIIDKVDSKLLKVSISYSQHSGHFFIDFEENGICLPSVQITESQALAYSREFGIKILQ